MRGHKDMLKCLLKSGAAVNDKNTKSMTPLDCAATAGKTEAAKVLIWGGLLLLYAFFILFLLAFLTALKVNLNFLTSRSQMPFEKSYGDKKVFKKGATRFKENGTSFKDVLLIKVKADSLLISYSKADIFQGVS